MKTSFKEELSSLFPPKSVLCNTLWWDTYTCSWRAVHGLFSDMLTLHFRFIFAISIPVLGQAVQESEAEELEQTAMAI